MALIFSANGPRSVDDNTILHVYQSGDLGRYVQVTICLANGEEVSGLMHVEALKKLKAKLDAGSPPQAA
jgi:hypothetical protein